MAKMAVATFTRNRSAFHEESFILRRGDVLLRDRLPETRPARAGFEFRAGIEQRRIAADAAIKTRRVIVPINTSKCDFSTRLPRDLEGFRRKLRAPLRLGFRNLRHARAAQLLARSVEILDDDLIRRPCEAGNARSYSENCAPQQELAAVRRHGMR